MDLGVGVLVVILHPLTNITGLGVETTIEHQMMVLIRLGLHNFVILVFGCSLWRVIRNSMGSHGGDALSIREILLISVTLLTIRLRGTGIIMRDGVLDLHSLFDISVSLNDVSRGSWGRSPCSDPTAIDDKYRTWCRDNNNWPYDGNWSFGFA